MNNSDYSVFPLRGAIRVIGPDAATYLQGQFSNDVRPRDSDAVTFGLWLNIKGKILADSYLLATGEEAYIAASSECSGERLKELVEERIVMDEVEVELEEAALTGVLLGKELAERFAGEAGVALPGPGKRVVVAGGFAFRLAAPMDAAVTLMLIGAEGDAVLERVRLLAEKLGGQELAEPERRALFWESGRFGVGDGAAEGDLPQEAGLDAWAVSFNKGCYIGQEVMARLKAMGRARRHLVLVRGTGPVPEGLPLALADGDGKKAGELRGAIAAASGWRGVAMVKDGADNLRFEGEGQPEVYIEGGSS